MQSPKTAARVIKAEPAAALCANGEVEKKTKREGAAKSDTLAATTVARRQESVVSLGLKLCAKRLKR